MHLAHPLPWWLAALVALAIGALAFAEYRRPLAPLSLAQRSVLVGLRALTLAAIVLFLLRPIVRLPPIGARDAIVPVLVDVSRSMRIADADGQPRLARATALLKTDLLPALSRDFTPELYAVGEGLAPASIDRLSADARQSDVSGALSAVRDRVRGQRVAGVVLLSDGGNTGRQTAIAASDWSGPPVFAIGIGSPEGVHDREVVGMSAGEQRLDQASIDLHVTAVSNGFGRAPFELRVLANGRVLETRRIVPPADGSPVDELFTVSPDPHSPTVYTAAIPVDESEPVVENNTRSVLVSPAGRKRRLLVVEGSPGFDHSFMTRAWSHDPALDVDSVARKGKNDAGQDTFFVQAGAARAQSLVAGFPTRREALFAYDGLVIANVEADFFTRAQLAMAAEFVSERGGGLLVLGERSFTQRGLSGTPLEDALPVELTDRRGLLRTSLGDQAPAGPNKLVVTPEGERHPIMRIGGSADESRRMWAALPPLAASSPLGGPRPGATVLAVTTVSGGATHPLAAVQRYGQGRSMVFAGEAAWRWKMLLPSTDRSYEFFWRQAARWLAAPSPDPVALTLPEGAEPGDPVAVEIDARDAAFTPIADAAVEASATLLGGDARTLPVRHGNAASGRYTAVFRPEQAGVYRIAVQARRGTTPLGAAERWLYVGGSDREFDDPRLNEAFLRRVSRASGGRYLRAADSSRVVSALKTAVPQNAAPEIRDLWHEPWAFALVVGLLSAEWILRRRWGLR